MSLLATLFPVFSVRRPVLTGKFHLLQLPLHGLPVWWFVSSWGITGAALAQSIRLSAKAVLLLVAAGRMTSLPFRSLIYDKLLQTSLLLFLFVGIAIGISQSPGGNLGTPAGVGDGRWGRGYDRWCYSLDRRTGKHVAKLFSPASVR